MMGVFDPGFLKRFVLFTPSHINTMILVAALLILVLTLFTKEKIKKKYDFAFRVCLAVVMVGQYLGWMLWEALCGRFTVALSLPINLCDFSNFLCAFLLIYRSYRLYEVLYFWALAGSIQSFITPNIYFAFPHLEFIVFYIQHGAEILTILYLTLVSGYRPQSVSMVKSFGLLGLFTGFVYMFNLAFDTNYMFLMADTPQPSTVTKMISIFGQPPRHIIGLCLVALVSILILYAPFWVKDLAAKKKRTLNEYD